MPRKKTYTTQKARRQADRLKAARHYTKNRDTINAKRRESRRRQTTQERQQELSQARTELEKQALEQKERRHGLWEGHPMYRVHEISQSLKMLTIVSPTEFLESLYQEYRTWVTGARTAPSPLEKPSKSLSNMITELNRLSSTLLAQYGNGQYYKETEATTHRIRLISSCLDDLELAFYDDCLEGKHTAGKLKYQNTLHLTILDGVL